MAKNRSGKKDRKRARATPLASHKKRGSKLVGPWSDLNVTSVEWERDLLPEHLWIASLAVRFGLDVCHKPFSDVLDALDEFTPGPDINLGLVSDFGRVPPDRRADLLAKYSDLFQAGLMEPCGRWLCLYPDAPTAWLTNALADSDMRAQDPMATMAAVRNLVVKLLPGKDPFAGRVRALPLARMFKHNTIRLFEGLSVIPLIQKYPALCTDDEKREMEAFARNTLNQALMARQVTLDHNWPSYFWRHNYDLAVCVPARLKLEAGDAVSQSAGETLVGALEANASTARAYLDGLTRLLRIDLYEPLPDEILFGLFARLTRLYCLLADNSALWGRDSSGIFLRCLAETAITFSYLAKQGTLAEFRSFRDYGEGQAKLLALHIQDNHPDAKTVDGLNADQVAERFAFATELLDIELGHWSKKDTRRLATEAGLEDLYRLVFNPTSADVHGTWISLKSSNLLTCSEPLHRFHRLPSLVDPPLFLNTVDVATSIYERCRELARAARSYPEVTTPLTRLAEVLQTKADAT